MTGPWERFDLPAEPVPVGKPWERFDPPVAAGEQTLSGLVAGRRPAVAPLSRVDKYLRGLRDPIDGGAQLLTNMLPDGLVSGVNKANNWLADKTGMVARIPEGGVDQMVRDSQRQYEGQRKAQGETGFDGYRTLGNVVNPVNLGAGRALPAAASLAGRMGIGAASGAAFGALTPVGEGDFVEEKLKQVGVGALTGGALPAVVSGAARIVSPLTSKNANLKLLRAEGVKPTIGQAVGGLANRAEEKLTGVPFLGDMIASARNKANEGFQAAAFNRALKPVGEMLPDNLTGRDALVYTESLLREKYDDVLAKIGAITPDAQFTSKIADLNRMVKGFVMPKAEKEKFVSALSDVKQSMDRNGVITSDAYKALESSLGSDARKLAGSQNIYEGKMAPAVRQLQQELREMLSRQAGQHANDLKSANAAWANFKRVQGATGKIGAEDGNFSPAQFLNAVRGLDTSKDKAAFARGSALGQDLGDAGKTVLGNKVVDSGTSTRAMWSAGALGATAVNPTFPLGLAAGTLGYTSPVQRALVAAVASRPQGADAVAELLRRSSPYLSAPAAPVAGGLLGNQ